MRRHDGMQCSIRGSEQHPPCRNNPSHGSSPSPPISRTVQQNRDTAGSVIRRVTRGGLVAVSNHGGRGPTTVRTHPPGSEGLGWRLPGLAFVSVRARKDRRRAHPASVSRDDDDGGGLDGELPPEVVESLLVEAYDRYRPLDEGQSPTTSGPGQRRPVPVRCEHLRGRWSQRFGRDAERLFSIQSISKAFVFALVCDAIGHEQPRAAGRQRHGWPSTR